MLNCGALYFFGRVENRRLNFRRPESYKPPQADRLAREAGRFEHSQKFWHLRRLENRIKQVPIMSQASWCPCEVRRVQQEESRVARGQEAWSLAKVYDDQYTAITCNHCIHLHLNHCQALRGELEQASRSKVFDGFCIKKSL